MKNWILTLVVVLLACSPAEDSTAVAGSSAESAAPPDQASATLPAEDSAAAFTMTVLDVLKIAGGSLVLTGRIESGTVSTGDTVCLQGAAGGKTLSVMGIESFNKILDSASAGKNVGLQFTGLTTDEVAAGDRLYAEC